MRRIPHEVVGALIALGRTGVPGVPGCLANEQTAWSCLIRRKEVWQEVADTLSEDELRHLIQGLVLYSRARQRGTGGSVSPVICLYSGYVKRFPDSEASLAAWIVDNRVNTYEPFGRICRGGVRSYRQFLEFVRESELEAKARERAREEQAARARELKQKRISEKATSDLPNAVRRGDLKAIVALLDKGADPQAAAERNGSLVGLADANERGEVAAYLRSRGIA